MYMYNIKMPYNLRSRINTNTSNTNQNNTRYFNTPIDPNPVKIDLSDIQENNEDRQHQPGYYKTEWVMDNYLSDEEVVVDNTENIRNLIKEDSDDEDNNFSSTYEITGLEKLRQDYQDRIEERSLSEERSQSVPDNFESKIDHSYNGFTWNENQTWPNNEWVNDYDYSNNNNPEFNPGFDENENNENNENNINGGYQWTTDYDYDYNDNLYQWAQDTNKDFKIPVKTENVDTQTENESVTTDQDTQTEYDIRSDMNPVNQINSGGTLFYRVSICGKTYIAIEDVFKYVTLGGSLPKQDLEYLRDDVNNYIYGKDYIFSEDQKIRVVSNYGKFMKDQSPDIIEIVRYEIKDYRLIAKVCLDYAYRYNKYIAY
jgi:hypothetical protein